MSFTLKPLSIPDVILVEASTAKDNRGFFREVFKQSAFDGLGLPGTFVQDNLSHSACGVLRGLHYQKDPRAQGKFLSVVYGEVYDVAVDIRNGSPSYGRWVGAILSATNGCMLYVPPGFAHGFCVLSDAATLLYKVTAEWDGALEAGVRWDDPQINVDWPVKTPILSIRDAALPFLKDADNNFVY